MGGIFEGNQFMFLVLLALVISGALRVALELKGTSQQAPPVTVTLPGCNEVPGVSGLAAGAGANAAGVSTSVVSTVSSLDRAATTITTVVRTAPSGVPEAVPEADSVFAGLQPWIMPASLSGGIFPPGSVVDPSKFRLHVKVLAFDRADSILRSLESLEAADYGKDTVNLDIFIDHTFAGEPGKWTKQAERKVGKSHALLLRLDGFRWSHGEKRVVYRSQNMGIQPQWLEAWWPESLNDFALIVEDDMEVSPLYYLYFKRLLAHYYYNASNFEPHMYGVSFQRQTFVAGIGGSPVKPSRQPFLYQLVGTWGQFLLPLPWRAFRLWYDHRRHNSSREPVLQGLKTTQWWFNKGNRLWTPWIIKWAYSESMFNLYPAFPSNLSLSISHRDKGSNFAKNRGADSALISAIPDKARDPVRRWWDAAFPPLNKVLRRDLCFKALPHYPPARQLDELNLLLESMKLEVKRVALIIVPQGGYDLVRNWLCHVERTGFRGFVLVVSSPEQASTLANMGHMVYLISTEGKGEEGAAAQAPGVNQWTASHVQLVLAALSFGFDVLVHGPEKVWVGNPLSTDLGEGFDMWGFLDPINFSDSCLYVHSIETTIAAWSRLRTAWMKAEATGKSAVLLQQGAQGQLMGRDITFETVEGIPADRIAEPRSPTNLPVLTGIKQGSKGEKIAELQIVGLWVIDDFDFACKAIYCRRRAA